VKLPPLAREVPVSSDDRYPEKVRKVAEVQELREHDRRKLLTEKEAGLTSEKCAFDSLKPSGQAPVSEGFGEEFDFLVEDRKKQNRILIVNEPYRAGHPRSPYVAEGGRRCGPYQVQCGEQPKVGEGLAKDEDESRGCDQVQSNNPISARAHRMKQKERRSPERFPMPWFRRAGRKQDSLFRRDSSLREPNAACGRSGYAHIHDRRYSHCSDGETDQPPACPRCPRQGFE
jgi:hypothetical protein